MSDLVDPAPPQAVQAEPLLRVEHLRKHFTVTRGFPKRETVTVRAVDGISFSIAPGTALGLVGESGCGKSTAARALLRLIEPDSGRVLYRGQDVTKASGGELRALRRKMQIVFQDPYSSLDPRQTIGSALMEPLRLHGIARGAAARDRAASLLEEVGLPAAALDRYPHEFSGGQRQRIGIARALTVEPELIVADEPVSALDVSVQAQVLLLLRDLQRRRGLSFLFVSHDLSVVRWFCDRVAVMYLGRIIEEGPVDRVLADPLHPYARVLRDASPVPDPALRGALPRISGELPSAAKPPPGCHFHPRCPAVMPVCPTRFPGWTEKAGGGVACYLHGE
ncbi:ABC transporter ATP-binding protein [Muricoccus radiodurans]|uniref:ABC transporter ATP-binding protein n=1 Tax=Muricoccus radiodurans TaxID=2231721 RepID=UPI003CF96C41